MLQYGQFLLTMASLHEEILAFQDMMQLTPDEHFAREATVDTLKAMTKRLFPKTQLEVFGSTVTGLMLPSSDIDLRIIDSNTDVLAAERGPSIRGPRALKQLLQKLRVLYRVFSNRPTQYKDPELRIGRVPIVVVTSRGSGLEIQVSTKNDQLTSQEYVKNYLVEFPTLRPLFVAVKRMLQMRGLTDVFCGGLGSYSIVMMIVAFLKLHPPLRADPAPLGRLLREFLVFYAEFDTYKFGLSIEPPLKFDKYPSTGKPTTTVKEAIALDSVSPCDPFFTNVSIL